MRQGQVLWLVRAGLTAVVCAATLVACGGGGSSSSGDSGDSGGSGGSPPNDEQPQVFNIFQAASVVIGQADFTGYLSNQGGSADADRFSGPYGNPLVHNGTLYLPDYGNVRVLGFDSVPTINGASADFVLGQPDFTTTAVATTQSGMRGPQGLSMDDGKLFLTDYDNSRITIYNNVPTSGPGSADVVVGQPDFFSFGIDTTPASLDTPEGSFAVTGKLTVTDTRNNRVLIWNTIPTTNGAPADIVLGQDDFFSNAANDVDQDGFTDPAPSARTLSSPSGVWSDGTRLVVLDSDNNRVLIWNTFPTVNFAPADVVLGQADFTRSAANDDDQNGFDNGEPTSRTLNNPYVGVYGRNGQLFVADSGNNRVLIWDVFPTANFTPADVVLGQCDFLGLTANDADCNGVADLAPSDLTLYFPTGIYVGVGQLIVADEENNRYLVYEAQ